jgi:hypothetical protein
MYGEKDWIPDKTASFREDMVARLVVSVVGFADGAEVLKTGSRIRLRLSGKTWWRDLW